VNDHDAYDYSASFNFTKPPTGPRVTLKERPIPESSRRYVAAHPSGPNDGEDPT
jgi:hypothetical protein